MEIVEWEEHLLGSLTALERANKDLLALATMAAEDGRDSVITLIDATHHAQRAWQMTVNVARSAHRLGDWDEELGLTMAQRMMLGVQGDW